MLAYLLALTVGLGSFALYMAAFFFPEVHRKNDFIWSGVGLFYALVLWVCAARITGGVLLGQAASVTLLGWLGWQTLLLRRQVVPAEQQTAVPSPEELKETVVNLASPENLSKLAGQAGQQATKLKAWGQAKLKPAVKSADSAASKAAEQPYVPLTPADFASADRPPVRDVPAVSIAEPVAVPESIAPESIAPESIVPESIVPEPVNFPDLPTPERSEAAPPASETVPSQKITRKSPEPKPADKPTGGLGGAFQQMLGGNKKRESKPVYVRKQFRDPDPVEAIVATPPTEVEALQPDAVIPELAVGSRVEAIAAVEPVQGVQAAGEETGATIVEDTDLPADAILESEIAYEANHPDLQPTSEDSSLQPVPPHPPAAELVEAALMDAEIKDIPASPPAIESSSPPNSPEPKSPEAQESDQ